MPMTLKEIFNTNPEVEIIEFFGYDDGMPFGLSTDRKRLKILDVNFAQQLAELPSANTESGHITAEGYCVHGRYIVSKDSYKASVRRVAR